MFAGLERLAGKPALLAALLLVSGAMAAVFLIVAARILGLPLNLIAWVLRGDSAESPSSGERLFGSTTRPDATREREEEAQSELAKR